MGKKVIEKVVDDFDGLDLPEDATPQTITFGGKKYEVYMSERNVERFQSFLNGEAPLVNGSVRVSRGTSRKTTGPSITAEDREWLRKNGFPETKTIGRLSKAAQEALGNR